MSEFDYWKERRRLAVIGFLALALFLLGQGIQLYCLLKGPP